MILLAIATIAWVVPYLLVDWVVGYGSEFLTNGDNKDYLRIADAIQSGNYVPGATKHFWGLPLGIATMALIPGISSTESFFLLNFAAFFGAIFLIVRQFGARVAVAFLVLGWDWVQRGVVGGAEPWFCFLIYSSLLCIKYRNTKTASLFAALATITRPWGISLLIGYGIALLHRRDFRSFCQTLSIALLIGGIYLGWVGMATGNATENFSGYQGDWDHGSFPLTFPFLGMIRGFILIDSPATNTAKIIAYLLISLAGCVAAIRSIRSENESFIRAPGLFYLIYMSLTYCYNSWWAWTEFPRFFIPVLPIVLYYFRRRIPVSPVILLSAGLVSSILFGASIVGVREFLQFLQRY